jgi:stage III sporulation protein AD
MDVFLKCCAGVMLAVVLTLTLGNRSKDIGIVLIMGVCCLVSLAVMRYLRPVVDFLETLVAVGGLDTTLFSIMLKVVGIGLVSEIAAMICADSGNASLGKTLQILGNAVILWLALPLFSIVLELIQTILGEL